MYKFVLNVLPRVPHRRWGPRIGEGPFRGPEGPEGVAEGHRTSAALVGKTPAINYRHKNLVIWCTA